MQKNKDMTKEEYLEMEDALIASSDPEEKSRLFNALLEFAETGGEEFVEAYREGLDRALLKCDQIILRQNLEFILKSMNLTYIAKEYFGKSHSWLSQRINGNLVNGKPAKFTVEEVKIFKDALADICQRITLVADRL